MIRDLCDHDERVSRQAYRWVQSQQFDMLCTFVDLDQAAAREVVDGLWSVPHRVRNQMLKEIIQQAVGSGVGQNKKKEPA